MSLRQVVLDTETTGLKVEEGHRIIEIGCIELVNRKMTDKNFHFYLNPGRTIDAGALAVHGISNEFLQDKPFFGDIADQLLDFLTDAELIIHNAPFDLGFINYELSLLNKQTKKINELCKVIDTLQLARKIHAGQRNSLDNLCKRYKIDLSSREYHGALLDASLLAQVYLQMTGGQGSFFDQNFQIESLNQTQYNQQTFLTEKYQLILKLANAEELLEHQNYMEEMRQTGKCIWT